VKVKLTVEYAGEDFAGWQRQPGQQTVQASLEDALQIFLRGEAKKTGSHFDRRIEIMGSGRTDSGVHARGQVASFSWPEEFPVPDYRLKDALNAITPEGIIVRSLEQESDDFDARHSPHIKCYSYRLIYRGGEQHAARFTPYERNRVWCITRPLDLEQMIRAARLLEGQHDFQSFRARDCSAKSTVRTVLRSELVRVADDELRYFIVGKGFLKQMVRIVVGTLVELGIHGEPASKMEEILLSKERTRAGKTAPANGLTLEWVTYSGAGLL